MKQSVNFSMFCDAFRANGRAEQFSYEAKRAIFDYIESYEDASGEEIELDVIAICCEWSEETPEEIAESYDIDLSECTDEEDAERTVMDYLDYHTSGGTLLDNGNIVYVQL